MCAALLCATHKVPPPPTHPTPPPHTHNTNIEPHPAPQLNCSTTAPSLTTCDSANCLTYIGCYKDNTLQVNGAWFTVSAANNFWGGKNVPNYKTGGGSPMSPFQCATWAKSQTVASDKALADQGYVSTGNLIIAMSGSGYCAYGSDLVLATQNGTLSTCNCGQNPSTTTACGETEGGGYTLYAVL